MPSNSRGDGDHRTQQPGLLGSVVFFVGGLLFLGGGLVVMTSRSDLTFLVFFAFGFGATYFGGRGLARRFAEWYRALQSGDPGLDQRPWLLGFPTTVPGLVLANLVPIVGVALFDWNLTTLLLIYWLENGLVGIAFLAKIRHAEGGDDRTTLPDLYTSFIGKPKRALAGIFVVHYGGFWIGHGVFVLLFAFLIPNLEPAAPKLAAVAVLGFAVHHYVSYRVNYIGDKEYERLGPVGLMVEPYYRVFVLHFTILFVGFAIGFAGGSTLAVAMMAFMKTVFDVGAHLREHLKAR